MERLRGNPGLSAALTDITAAVVGVIAKLAVYFAVHTLFATTHAWHWGPLRLELPQPASLRPAPLAIAAAALVMSSGCAGRCHAPWPCAPGSA